MNKILEKIKKFIYKYLIEEEPEMLEAAKENQDKNINKLSNDTNNQKQDFKDYLNVKDYEYILTLQDRYEYEEVSEEELSIIEVMNLIDLYREQINELKMEIEIKEAKNV